MKSITRDFAKVCYALLFLISTRALSQESFSFTITSELSKQINDKEFDHHKAKIFPVSYKEIEFKTYDNAVVLTNEYKSTISKLNQLKPEYDKYMNAVQMSKGKQEAIQIISQNIDRFLTSDEKYEVKEKLLIESQSLSDKYNIKVSIDDTRIKLESFIQPGERRPTKRNVLLYEKDNRSNKNDLKIFKDEIQKIKVLEPEKTYAYDTYVGYAEDTLTMKKTELGKVLSNETIKKMTYMIDDVNPVQLTSFSGRFIELSKKYRWVFDNIDIEFVKDELTDDNKYDFNKDQSSELLPLIQNVDTNEYYFVSSNSYITKLKQIESEKELLDIVHKLGYKEYKSNDRYDENLYIKSKACEIKLNNWTYNCLKKSPLYITALDNHQMKLDALIKQTIQHSKTLDKYLGLYRIQRNKMSTTNINAWRASTSQAQKLNDQMVSIDEKYAGDYSFMPLNNLSNIRENFSDNLGASKGVLGM